MAGLTYFVSTVSQLNFEYSGLQEPFLFANNYHNTIIYSLIVVTYIVSMLVSFSQNPEIILLVLNLKVASQVILNISISQIAYTKPVKSMGSNTGYC